jgi:hypothetical protein
LSIGSIAAAVAAGRGGTARRLARYRLTWRVTVGRVAVGSFRLLKALWEKASMGDSDNVGLMAAAHGGD